MFAVREALNRDGLAADARVRDLELVRVLAAGGRKGDAVGGVGGVRVRELDRRNLDAALEQPAQTSGGLCWHTVNTKPGFK
jgi:hypothetical protein